MRGWVCFPWRLLPDQGPTSVLTWNFQQQSQSSIRVAESNGPAVLWPLHLSLASLRSCHLSIFIKGTRDFSISPISQLPAAMVQKVKHQNPWFCLLTVICSILMLLSPCPQQHTDGFISSYLLINIKYLYFPQQSLGKEDLSALIFPSLLIFIKEYFLT